MLLTKYTVPHLFGPRFLIHTPTPSTAPYPYSRLEGKKVNKEKYLRFFFHTHLSTSDFLGNLKKEKKLIKYMHAWSKCDNDLYSDTVIFMLSEKVSKQ